MAPRKPPFLVVTALPDSTDFIGQANLIGNRLRNRQPTGGVIIEVDLSAVLIQKKQYESAREGATSRDKLDLHPVEVSRAAATLTDA